MPPRPQFGLDDIVGGARRLVEGNRRTFKGQGPYPEGSSINTAIQQGAVKPLKTLGEFSGMADAYRGFTPGASVGRQALGLASILTPLSAQEEAIVGAQKLASAMAKKTVGNSYLLGKTVVHGSPERGLKYIDPQYGSRAMPKDKVVFSWNPKAFGTPGARNRYERGETIVDTAGDYTVPKDSDIDYDDYFLNSDDLGSFYVGKMKRGSIVNPPENAVNRPFAKLMTVGTKPIKVTAEIPANVEYPAEAVADALKRGGVGIFDSTPKISDLAKKMAEKAGQVVSKIPTPSPKVNFNEYLLHGGPMDLQGGKVSPQFVRGGEELAKVNPRYAMEPSVVDLNRIEDQQILQRYEQAQNIVAQGRNPAYPKSYDDAKKLLERDAEVVNRIKAGEEHMTAVGALDPQMAYSHQGATHILNVPENMYTQAGPAGELKFFGEYAPKASVPFNPAEMPADFPGSSRIAFNEFYNINPIRQAVVDVADQDVLNTQKLASALARLKGNKVTPGFKQYIEDMLARDFDFNFQRTVENPNARNQFDKYMTDFDSPQMPYIQNYDQVVQAIRNARTQDDIVKALRSAIPSETLNNYLTSGLPSNAGKAFGPRMGNITDVARTLRGDYGRLRK
jgi:hypothetical protein